MSFTVRVALKSSPAFCWVATVGFVTFFPLFSGMERRAVVASSETPFAAPDAAINTATGAFGGAPAFVFPFALGRETPLFTLGAAPSCKSQRHGPLRLLPEDPLAAPASSAPAAPARRRQHRRPWSRRIGAVPAALLRRSHRLSTSPARAALRAWSAAALASFTSRRAWTPNRYRFRLLFRRLGSHCLGMGLGLRGLLSPPGLPPQPATTRQRRPPGRAAPVRQPPSAGAASAPHQAARARCPPPGPSGRLLQTHRGRRADTGLLRNHRRLA